MKNKGLKILIDITHPADVHQFKFIISLLKKENKVKVVARYKKDSVVSLLDKYGIDYEKRYGYNNIIAKLLGLFVINFQLAKSALKFKADIIIGSTGNCYVAQVAWLLRKPSIILDDTEHSSLQNLLTFPFAKKILTPQSYMLDLGAKQVRYNGTKEMFYLSQKYFSPSEKVHQELKSEDKVFFLRFISWDANHDIGRTNTFERENLVKFLERFGKVVVSAEGEVEEYLKKYLMPNWYKEEYHSVLYYSSLVITEGASTAAEAAVLGTPCIYINPLKLGYIEELESSGRIVSTTDYNELKELVNRHVSNGARKNFYESELDLNDFVINEIYKSVKN